jgi:Zn-dependent metalloprotease
MRRLCRCVNCITPPHLLRKMLESDDPAIRRSALGTIIATARLRGERTIRASFAGGAMSPSGNGRRTVFDLKGGTDLTDASTARTEDGEPSGDETVNRAFEGLGKTREFFSRVLDRNSIDDRGMRLDAYVHRGSEEGGGYNNAFWDGQQMVFGDGDGVLFTDFTLSLDVIAHELAHGVTEASAGLEYHRQPGALNESMSDVFGSLVKQWSRGETADSADWLIGKDIFTPKFKDDALRSLKAPGTAYDNAFGKDPQPDHMKRFAQLPDNEFGDWGGVHINSGIPNKAFHLVAVAVGGNAWEAPGHIWYESLKASNIRTSFQEFAETTFFKADELYGSGSPEQQAVRSGWREVGIQVRGTSPGRGRRLSAEREEDSLAELTRQIATLAAEVKTIGKEVAGLKARR